MLSDHEYGVEVSPLFNESNILPITRCMTKLIYSNYSSISLVLKLNIVLHTGDKVISI